MSPDQFKEAINEINNFEHLKAGWDSDAALPIESSIRERAISLLADTRTVAATPDVLATPAGGIDMIWRVNLPKGPARVELHVMHKGVEVLVRLQGHRRHPIEAIVDDSQARDILLKQLKSVVG